MPSMPQVETNGDIRGVFAQARKVSARFDSSSGGPTGVRAVAIVTPGRLIMPVPCPPADAVSPQMMESIRRIVPEHPKQRISVIADNNVVAASAFTAREANELIPFLGILMGMAFDEHNVVVFEGHPSAVAAGCEGATLLLVDQAMVAHLQPEWATAAASVMAAPNILVFGRDGRIAKLVPDRGSTAPPAPETPPVRKKRSWWPFGGGS